jgi:DNA-binding NtrC family response regulator
VQEHFLAYPWPGNVRELANVIERAVVLGAGPQITLQDLPPSLVGTPPLLASPVPSALSYHDATAAFVSCCARRWPRPRAIIRRPPRPWGCNAPISNACSTPSTSANPLGYTLYPKGYRP